MRRPVGRGVVSGSVVAAVIAACGWGVGLSWPNGLTVGLAVVTVYGLRRLPPMNLDERWHQRSDERTDRGVRREVTRLSWSLQGYEERVELNTVRRLRRVAAGRLGGQGLSLDEPGQAEACRRQLGPETYALLTGLDGPRPSLTRFAAAVAAVERLERAEPR